MKILVIDDSPMHQAAARQTIIGHNLTIASSADQALELLGVRESNRGKIVCAEPFDVVLCDMLMPAPRYLQHYGPSKEDLIAIGFPLTLIAVRAGAKYVAMATDTDHHSDPMCGVLEPLNGPGKIFNIDGAWVLYMEWWSDVLVDGTTCTTCNGTGSNEVCYCVKRNAGAPMPDCGSCNGTGHSCSPCWNSGKQWGKNWGALLNLLIKRSVPG